MASKTPLIFLAFANSATNPLENLKQERKTIKELMTPLEGQNQLVLKDEAQADVQDIFTAFNSHQKQLSILHYAGHANGHSLRLEDAKFEGKTLADLVKIKTNNPQSSPLALIFLNGCATQGQVDELLQAGAHCVIATQTNVGDHTATEFATQYYSALVQGKTLQESFDTAKAFIQNQYPTQAIRWSISNDHTQNSQKELAWGLYTNKEEYKHWKLTEGTGTSSQKTDFALVNKSLELGDYHEVIAQLDPLFEDQPNYQYSNLKKTIMHYLNQGLMPPPATLQGFKIFVNNLSR
jgi:CHAT domain-containing protein